MIVVDTSALIAILLAEAEADRCSETIKGSERIVMSAASLAETLLVAMRKDAVSEMAALVFLLGIEVEPLTEVLAVSAAESYRAWGKGRHPAALNFGDSFSYALAKHLNCPLLFVGADFS